MDLQETKAAVLAQIDRRADEALDVAKHILNIPEPGFREQRTSRFVAQKLSELGIPFDDGLALTGLKGMLTGGKSGPTVGVFGELDSLIVPGHPFADPETHAVHACGHHTQIGSLLTVAMGLQAPGVLENLAGRVALLAVPAEEFIEIEYRDGLRSQGKLEFLGGKSEFVKLGVMDDVDIAMMTHTENQDWSYPGSKLGVGANNNGMIAKRIRFNGVASHAGGSPHLGVNALNAANIALMAIHAQRETFRDEESIRIHPIITKGGTVVSSVPADVRMETFVRGSTIEAYMAAGEKVDRALRAGAMAVGASVDISTIPGYTPLAQDSTLTELYVSNAAARRRRQDRANGSPLRLDGHGGHLADHARHPSVRRRRDRQGARQRLCRAGLRARRHDRRKSHGDDHNRPALRRRAEGKHHRPRLPGRDEQKCIPHLASGHLLRRDVHRVTGPESLKAAAQAAIDRRRDWIIDIAEQALRTPELGFREFETSRLVSEKLAELGIEHTKRVAITGVTASLRGGNNGPTAALLGELDALPLPGHRSADPMTGAAHACGHNSQIGIMIGAAVGLTVPEVRRALCGDVELMAVPAEEFVDVEYRLNLRRDGKIKFLSGKQELIRLGAFDHVDMAMMVHTSASPEDAKFSLGGTTNAHVGKYVRFLGKSAHAGSSPHRGVNALQAALVALHALNTQRETFQDPDVVRVHGIIAHGGEAANVTPAEVRYEGRVRGRTIDVVDDAACEDGPLPAGRGARSRSRGRDRHHTRVLPAPERSRTSSAVFRGNAERLVGASSFTSQAANLPRGGSTDMGDLSQIMPVIHPYTGGCSGTGHGDDYRVIDYDQAVVRPAKAIAMTVIDLLTSEAGAAKKVIENSRPPMTKESYLDLQDSRMSEETYTGS